MSSGEVKSPKQEVNERYKICTGPCGQRKLVCDFPPDRGMWCRVCHSERQKIRRQTDFLQMMVTSNYHNDIKRGRDVSNHLTIEENIAKYEKAVAATGCGELWCYYCGNTIYAGVGVDRNLDGDAATIERLDNSKPHTNENTVFACKVCQNLHQKDEDPLLIQWMELNELKHCSKCRCWKQNPQFNICASTRGGLYSWCQECQRKKGRDVNETRKFDAEKLVEYNGYHASYNYNKYQTNKKFRVKCVQTQRNVRAKLKADPLKHAAHLAKQRAAYRRKVALKKAAQAAEQSLKK